MTKPNTHPADSQTPKAGATRSDTSTGSASTGSASTGSASTGSASTGSASTGPASAHIADEWAADSCEVFSPPATNSGPSATQAWIKPALEAFYLTGPTASGKTSLGLAVAERLNAEIISLDSMAIYCGMDIGTAKPTAEDRQRVPHHLLDIVQPNQNYSVSCYVEAAHRVVAEIRSRGKRPLFVGGTPLYLKSLLRGLFMGPPASAGFRRAVEEDVAQYGTESLRARLMQVDPLAAHKLHPHDQRRMIRALEVAQATGRPLSHWQTQFETPATNPKIRAAVVGLDRAWLHERINRRVQQMIAAGLEREVRGLIERFGPLVGTAAQAVGYREMQAWFTGALLADQVVPEIQAHTRQFARRQEIWFRGLKELVRFELTPDLPLEQLADNIASLFIESDNAGPSE